MIFCTLKPYLVQFDCTNNHHIHRMLPVERFPSVITIPEHKHSLFLLPQVYTGRYGCDVCNSMGEVAIAKCHPIMFRELCIIAVNVPSMCIQPVRRCVFFFIFIVPVLLAIFNSNVSFVHLQQ